MFKFMYVYLYLYLSLLLYLLAPPHSGPLHKIQDERCFFFEKETGNTNKIYVKLFFNSHHPSLLLEYKECRMEVSDGQMYRHFCTWMLRISIIPHKKVDFYRLSTISNIAVQLTYSINWGVISIYPVPRIRILCIYYCKAIHFLTLSGNLIYMKPS